MDFICPTNHSNQANPVKPPNSPANGIATVDRPLLLIFLVQFNKICYVCQRLMVNLKSKNGQTVLSSFNCRKRNFGVSWLSSIFPQLKITAKICIARNELNVVFEKQSNSMSVFALAKKCSKGFLSSITVEMESNMINCRQRFQANVY